VVGVGHDSVDDAISPAREWTLRRCTITADGVAGSNGVYRYCASAFPGSIFNSSDYWIDVVFAPNA
jgi:hypothetical protein